MCVYSHNGLNSGQFFVAVRTFKVGRDSVGAEILLQIIIICHFTDLVVHHALFNPVINELLKFTEDPSG